MKPALPRFRAAPTFNYVDRGPRFTSPTGVTLRLLEPGEYNYEPVLVCVKCNLPTLHDRLTAFAICRACGTERRW